MDTEVVYNGRNNTIDLLFKADGTAVDLDSVTKVVLVFRDPTGTEATKTITDESSTQWPIKWAVSETGTTGKMLLRLGDQSISSGLYYVDFVIYDNTNTDGIDWSGTTGVPIYVKGETT
jgi:hypothetical protein